MGSPSRGAPVEKGRGGDDATPPQAWSPLADACNEGLLADVIYSIMYSMPSEIDLVKRGPATSRETESSFLFGAIWDRPSSADALSSFRASASSSRRAQGTLSSSQDRGSTATWACTAPGLDAHASEEEEGARLPCGLHPEGARREGRAWDCKVL